MYENTLLEKVAALGAFYQCPKSPDGTRLGPLVGYAGNDDKGKQKVGDAYFNYARVEAHTRTHRLCARLLLTQISQHVTPPFCLVGAPMGGIMLARSMADMANCAEVSAVFMEKRDEDLILLRHEIPQGVQVVIVDDVFNNGSTVGKAKAVIEAAGGILIATACVFNRSAGRDSNGVPITALVNRTFPQFTQDDPRVAHDVTRGNVVWRPKHEWQRLKAAMKANAD